MSYKPRLDPDQSALFLLAALFFCFAACVIVSLYAGTGLFQ